MKAWIVSEMHVNNSELARNSLEIPEADICICAGDVSGIVEMSVQYVLRNISPRMPVVMTLGNHEFYGATIDAGLRTAKRMTIGTNVTVLENETFFFGNARIVGRRCGPILKSNTASRASCPFLNGRPAQLTFAGTT